MRYLLASHRRNVDLNPLSGGYQLPRLSTLALGLALSFVAASSADAENAYRWVDAQGRVFYGSKPPPAAKGVESVKAKSFSKYSSSKVLKAYSGKSGSASPVGDTPAARARMRDSVKDDGVSEATLIDPTNFDLPTPAQLDHSPVSIERDPKNRVTECAVNVKNFGAEKASAIKVTFEFSDGTLIQTDGPRELRPGADATFSVPANLLPITLRSTKTSDPELAKLGSTPKVLFDFTSVPDTTDTATDAETAEKKIEKTTAR